MKFNDVLALSSKINDVYIDVLKSDLELEVKLRIASGMIKAIHAMDEVVLEKLN